MTGAMLMVGLPKRAQGKARDFNLHPLQPLQAAESDLPGSCRRIAQYIIDNPQLVASLPIDKLAEVTGSNKTAVVRTCKLVGYRGYRELRAALLENRGLLRGA